MPTAAADQRPIPLRDSIAAPLTLASALFSLLLVAALYLAAVRLITAEAEAAALGTVDADLAGLVDVAASAGRRALIQRIADREALAPVEGDVMLYALDDRAGARLAGQLATRGALDPARSEAGTIALADGRALARATRLDGGLTLTVARRLDRLDALLADVRRSFLLIGLAALAVALLLGWRLTQALRPRLAAISRAYAQVEAGEPVDAIPGRAARDEIGRIARQSQRVMERLADSVAAYRQIADSTAHEIRTPLTHLDQQLFKLVTQSTDPAAQSLAAAGRTRLRTVIQLLESLLDISASRAARSDPAALPRVDLSTLATSLVELYQPSAEELGLRFTAQIAAGVTLPGDEAQLMRLLGNLLDNAFKYCPAGSHIRLIVAPGPRLEVADDGPGIAAADRPRIFDRFARAGDPAAPVACDSHGLGLTLARAVAERHGLAIRVEDAGPGARFIIAPPPEEDLS